jgi:hypothetical protein
MPLDETDLWLLASLLIRRDGESALSFAQSRAEACAASDTDAAEKWAYVAYAVAEILRPADAARPN